MALDFEEYFPADSDFKILADGLFRGVGIDERHIHRQVDAMWCLSFHFLRLVSWLGLLGPLLGPYVLADASLHSYHPPVKKKEGEKKETKQHKETKIKPREKSPVRLPFL